MSTLDRDAAREELLHEPRPVEEVLDALEGCVRPEPQQTIDRDLLVQGLGRAMHPGMGEHPTPEWLADWVLALLRPVTEPGQPGKSGEDDAGLVGRPSVIVLAAAPPEGVVLTREEAALARDGLRWAALHPTDGAPPTWGSTWRALAERLEAES